MDIRQLQYVLMLADTLNFGRAAQRAYISQPSFSQQIARLEKQIGAKLFDRSSNRVALTAAGEAFLPHAQAIIQSVAEASQEARMLQGLGSKHLRIGVFFDGAGELTPLIIEAYRTAMPDVQISFQELTMTTQIEDLVSEKVDMVLLRSPIADRRVRVHDLYAQPRIVGLPLGHHLGSRQEVFSHDLLNEAFAVPNSEAPPQWGAYWSFDDMRGEPSRVAVTVRSISEGLYAIAYQGAIDTFPSSAARYLKFPGIQFLPLSDSAYSTVSIAVRTDEYRPHVEAFLRVAKQLVSTSLTVVPDAVPLEEAPDGTPQAD